MIDLASSRTPFPVAIRRLRLLAGQGGVEWRPGRGCGVSYHLFSCDETKARKQHRCIWCGEMVEQGNRYLREKSVYDGAFQDFAWHPECKQDQENDINNGGDCEFISHSAERPHTTTEGSKNGTEGE